MQLDDRKRKRFAGFKWAVLFEDEIEKTKILTALKEHGHAAIETEHLWQDKPRKMYDISFDAAEFICNSFPAGIHSRRLLKREGMRGWLAFMENGAKTITPSRVRANDSLFGGQRAGLRRFG